LRISEAELDIGRVYESSAHEHQFHITNSGDQAVTIRKFDMTCTCLGITPNADILLAPGESKAFTSKLALQTHGASLSSADGESFLVGFSATFTAEGQAPQAAAWQFRAVVLPAMHFNPIAVQFGTVSDRQAQIEKSVEIEALEQIQQIESMPSGEWTVEILPGEATPSSKRFRLIVRSTGPLQRRQVADTIWLIPVDREGKRLPVKELKVTGVIVGDVVAVPGQIHHGRQVCGAIVEEAIVLRSLAKRRFVVKSVTSSIADLEITRMGKEIENTGWTYSLRLRCTKTEDQEAIAEFVIRDEDGTECTLTVPVRYHGLKGP
jgi:hypothetical protein